MALDPKVDFIPCIHNSYFRSLRCRLSLVRFSLLKVSDLAGLLPNWIVERSVQARCTINSDGLSYVGGRGRFRLLPEHPLSDDAEKKGGLRESGTSDQPLWHTSNILMAT